jgi:hypothetical protein
MIFGYLTLATALIISLSSAVYSILGLTAIFAAAFWPIVVLGGSLEVGKIVTTLWLHKYWERAEIQYKVYLCSAVAILMLLTSMGVFGFLSKAHSDQSLVSGDVGAKIAIYDEKIKIERDNIDANRKQLKQMDEAVDQVMGRSTDEKGADKAVAIRRAQQKDRGRLLAEIGESQKKITALNEERAPIAAENRKVEAEVGPIKYIAALIYGDSPDANVLEKSVRWVIILIVAVFDPLALTLLLAATKSIEWERGINLFNLKKKDQDDQTDSTFVASAVDHLEPVLPEPVELPSEDYFSTSLVKQDTSHQTASVDPTTPGWMFTERHMGRPFTEQEIETITTVPDEEKIKQVAEETKQIEDQDPLIKMAKNLWLASNPGTTEHHEEFYKGNIDQLPWHDLEHINSLSISDRDRINLINHAQELQANRNLNSLKLEADNDPNQTGEVKGFGISFPESAVKGDMFLRVDQLPTVLYKFNGSNWIVVNKENTDQHAYDDAYIDYLIAKIESGEYDPDLLSNSERDSIEQRLKNNT